jgi:hypothetical protein
MCDGHLACRMPPGPSGYCVRHDPAPAARAWRREQASKAAKASHRPRIEAIAEKVAKLEGFRVDAGALATVVVRPDLATVDSRRAFREAVVRAVVGGAIDRKDAELLLRAASDQAREDGPKVQAEEPLTISVQRFSPEASHE